MKNNSKTRSGRKARRQETKTDCYFCKDGKAPSLFEESVLLRFVTERGKIQPRSRSGLCSKHQRKLTREVKKARYLAILPYVVRPE
jgi:small subunit ribosomal protein S18